MPVVRMTDRLLDKTEVDSIISVRGIVEMDEELPSKLFAGRK